MQLCWKYYKCNKFFYKYYEFCWKPSHSNLLYQQMKLIFVVCRWCNKSLAPIDYKICSCGLWLSTAITYSSSYTFIGNLLLDLTRYTETTFIIQFWSFNSTLLVSSRGWGTCWVYIFSLILSPCKFWTLTFFMITDYGNRSVSCQF